MKPGFSILRLSVLWILLAWTTGPLSGRSLSFAYDDRLRRTNLTFRSGSVTNGTIGYGFDASGRMTSIADGSSSATYSYVANSALLQQIQLKQGAATALTVTRQYDLLETAVRLDPTDGGGGNGVRSVQLTIGRRLGWGWRVARPLLEAMGSVPYYVQLATDAQPRRMARPLRIRVVMVGIL